MKYPAILKSKSESDTRIMLAYNKNEAARISSEPIDLFGGFNFDTSDAWQNITREYLANTYGEVESKEHAEFIIKLAEVAGFAVDICHLEGRKFFCFYSDVLLFSEQYDSSKRKIHIPLPPKEPKSKEWPQVGDEVLTASKQKAKLIATHDYHAWVKYYEEDNTFSLGTVAIATLSKPLTPEEELATLISNWRGQDRATIGDSNLAKAIINSEIKGLSYER